MSLVVGAVALAITLWEHRNVVAATVLGDSDDVSVRCIDNSGALSMRKGRRQDENWILTEMAPEVYFWLQRPTKIQTLRITPKSQLFCIVYGGESTFLRYVSQITDIKQLQASFAELNTEGVYGLAQLGTNLLITLSARPSSSGVEYKAPPFLNDIEGVKHLY